MVTAFYQTGGPPERLDLFATSNPCPVSNEGRGTARPDAVLERWKTMRTLVDDLLLNAGGDVDEVIDRHTRALDPVEASIVRGLAATAVRLLPDVEPDAVDLEPLAATVISEDETLSARVAFQYAFDLPTGRELYRLKIGRSGSSELERAVVALSGTVDGTPSDLNLHTGEITELAPPEAPTALLDDAFEEARRTESGIEPNSFCVTCRRVATCGAYPSGRRVLPTTCETVAVTKTDLVKLGQCERRVAWSRVHQIPRADRVDDSAALNRGILFHELATQLAESGSGGDVARALSRVAPEDRADFEHMLTEHQRLLDAEHLSIRKSKRWAGLTIVEGEGYEMRAVTLLGEIDFTADDGSGLALVEIKTGAAVDEPVESDLYALGVAAWFRANGLAVPELTVHHHFVRQHPGECHSVRYDEAQLAAADRRMRAAIAPILRWERDRPSSVAPTYGQWCQSCEFEATCRPQPDRS